MTSVSDVYDGRVNTPTAPRRRPKHDPEVTKREILDSAEQLLRERPLREISVDAIMSRTGLKRPAFYTHFRDRNDVALHVTQALADRLLATIRPWLDNGETLLDIRAAAEGLVAAYVEHGPVLRALADAAAADAQVEQAYRQIVQEFIAATAAHIRGEQARGHIGELPDVDETARALVWMEERYLVESLTRTPATDPEVVVDVLYRIWTATLYGVTAADDG